MMNRMRIACTIVLCLFFGAIVFAQEEKPREAPQQEQPEARPETPEQQQQPPENAKPEKQQKQKQTKEEKKAEKDAKSNSQQSKGEGSTAVEQQGQGGQMHAAGKGGHIPDDKFRAHFGKSHTFVINKPVVVNNQPTFVYGGYTFLIANPWPVAWAYTDDCYIDYVDGGYFLFDLLHPGMSIALIVEM